MIHLYTFLAEPYTMPNPDRAQLAALSAQPDPTPPRVCEWCRKPSTRPICPACVEEQRRRERKL